MKKLSCFTGLLGICMLAACSGENVCRVNGIMRGMEGQDSVYVLRSTGEFTRDTVMQASIDKDISTLNYLRNCGARNMN